jgi:hypothetical protein
MAIRTRMQKSGEKKVFSKKRSNVAGRLNRAARAVSTSEARDLTPGVVTELIDRRKTRESNQKQEAIIGNRRRRHTPNTGRGTSSQNKRA